MYRLPSQVAIYAEFRILDSRVPAGRSFCTRSVSRRISPIYVLVNDRVRGFGCMCSSTFRARHVEHPVINPQQCMRCLESAQLTGARSSFPIHLYLVCVLQVSTL